MSSTTPRTATNTILQISATMTSPSPINSMTDKTSIPFTSQGGRLVITQKSSKNVNIMARTITETATTKVCKEWRIVLRVSADTRFIPLQPMIAAQINAAPVKNNVS